MLFFILFPSGPRTVPAKSLECLQQKYPGCKVYRYRETNNPVTVENNDHGLFRAMKQIIPNSANNKYCYFN